MFSFVLEVFSERVVPKCSFLRNQLVVCGFSRQQPETPSAICITWRICLVKALEHAWLEGCFNSACFFEGLMGYLWDEETVSTCHCLGSLQATSEQLGRQLILWNCKYKLPCKRWWAWKGGTVSMGFNCSIWICLPTYALNLQAPQALVGVWRAGLWLVQRTS